MTGPNVSFSVLICTYDRELNLRRLLTSLQNQKYPRDKFEVIIINNASTARTKQVAEQFEDKSDLQVSFVQLHTPGLSEARNVGAQLAKGDILVYLDDDVLTAPKLLHSLAQSYKQCSESTVCIGGGVHLTWPEDKMPGWLPTKLLGYYGSTYDLGKEPRYLSANEFPVGANMSIRRKPMLELGGFSHQLGRKGNLLLSNEEVGFCQRIRKAGFEIYYEPSAHVWHIVSDSRTSKTWLIRRLYWQGISDAELNWLNDKPSRSILSKRVVVSVKKSLQNILGGLFFRLKRKNQESITHIAAGVAHIGQALQYFRHLIG